MTLFFIAISLLIITITTKLVIKFLKTPGKSEKIFGIYSQPGRWFYLKYIAFYCLLSARKLISKLGRISVAELEKLKPLSSHEKAFDAVFFHSVSQDGFYFCGGIERRHQAKANALFYLVVPEFGLLESLKLPRTLLDADPASVLLNKEYAAEGLSFTPIEPMKKWIISFNGVMKLASNPDRQVKVNLEGEWNSDFQFFLFERDMHARCLAKAIALEEWSKEYFETLKKAHQTHYEQMGYFQGTLSIDNSNYPLKMDSFRDHSFGYKRDWSLMHRYIYHTLHLTDGTRISCGKVSQPCTSSHLDMGYIVDMNKSIIPIDQIDLELYQHAENGSPPKNYAFCFKAAGKFYTVKVKVVHEAFHFKGNDIEAKLFERFVECSVNGVQGRGISEWHYNNAKLAN